MLFTSLRARITLAMTSVVALLGVASVLAVREVSRLEELSSEVARIDEAIRRVHRVSVAMRDVYAHQAHVVILDDRSHMDHLDEIVEVANVAIKDARRAAAAADAVEDVEDIDLIARVFGELDASFKRDMLPLVPGRGAAVAAVHDKAIMLLESGQRTADRLVARLDARVAERRVVVQATRERLVSRSVALFSVALGLAVVTALLLHKQVTAPVQALALASQKWSGGAFSTRVDVEGHHELASLARAFNEMAKELESREKTLLEAQRLAGVGRLAAGVAHEINNPLGVMKGYVALIERASDDAVKADAAMVRAEIARCQEIVAGLLDLARPPRPVITDVDVVAVANECAAPLSVPVRVTGSGIARADEGKLRQILRNLIGNAIEAGGDAEVVVDVVVAADVVVRVTDRGPGLSTEARARLFEPFFTEKPKGTGLGLAVSRSFAEAQGGSLVVAEAEEGGGACFVLRLPKAST